MTTRIEAESGPFRLGDSAWALLEKRVEAALRRARRERRRVIASVTAPVAADLDLSAAVLAARRAGDRFFCLEQPDRERSTLAALGEAALVETTGENRFREAAAACRELARGAEAADGLGDPPGSTSTS